MPGARHPPQPSWGLVAAGGRPAGPPDRAGPRGQHVASRVPAVSVPAPSAARHRPSRWSRKGARTDRGQEGLSAHLLLCLCGPSALATVLERPTSSAGPGHTAQHGEGNVTRPRRPGVPGLGAVHPGGLGVAVAGLEGGRVAGGWQGLQATLRMPQGDSLSLGGLWTPVEVPTGGSRGNSRLLRAWSSVKGYLGLLPAPHHPVVTPASILPGGPFPSPSLPVGSSPQSPVFTMRSSLAHRQGQPLPCRPVLEHSQLRCPSWACPLPPPPGLRLSDQKSTGSGWILVHD